MLPNAPANEIIRQLKSLLDEMKGQRDKLAEEVRRTRPLLTLDLEYMKQSQCPTSPVFTIAGDGMDAKWEAAASNNLQDARRDVNDDPELRRLLFAHRIHKGTNLCAECLRQIPEREQSKLCEGRKGGWKL